MSRRARSAIRKGIGQFLGEQIREQRPGLIIVLGIIVPHFLAATNLASEIRQWEKCKTFKAIDDAGPLITKARFGASGSGTVATVAVVVHPSYRPANLWRRQYAGLRGAEAEQRLLQDALAASAGTLIALRP